jgi:hypothetical protein
MNECTCYQCEIFNSNTFQIYFKYLLDTGIYSRVEAVAIAQQGTKDLLAYYQEVGNGL